MRYKSRFEFDFATYLESKNINFEYEPKKFKYIPKERTYTPDFYLVDYDMFIETKGHFVASDRSKHKLIAEQYPDLDLRFVFQDSKQRLNKKSKTTYANWCDKNNFQHANGVLPIKWLKNYG